MARRRRKRVNCSVDEELFDILGKLSRRYGFRSRCALTVCFARLMAHTLAARADGSEADGAGDVEMIARAFRELGDWERTAHKLGEYGEGQGL